MRAEARQRVIRGEDEPGPDPQGVAWDAVGFCPLIDPRTIVLAIVDWVPTVRPEVKVSVTSARNWTGWVVPVVESVNTRVQVPLTRESGRRGRPRVTAVEPELVDGIVMAVIGEQRV